MSCTQAGDSSPVIGTNQDVGHAQISVYESQTVQMSDPTSRFQQMLRELCDGFASSTAQRILHVGGVQVSSTCLEDHVEELVGLREGTGPSRGRRPCCSR